MERKDELNQYVNSLDGTSNEAVRSPSNQCKQTYLAILTFDDGPADEAGPDFGSALTKILATLKKHGVKGVFYAIGEEVKQYPEWAKRIVTEGHIIQNHSWQHIAFPKLSGQELHTSLKDTQEAIKSATGVTPDRVRPPFGEGMREQKVMDVARSLNLKLTYWDVDTRDWSKTNADKEHPRPYGLGLKRPKFDPQMPTWKGLYEHNKRPLDILMHVLDPTAADLDGLITEMKNDCWKFTTY